jgi:hypothetical protein
MAFGVFQETSRLLLGSFDNFARFDTSRAHLHPAIAARRELYADGLQIRIESTAGLVVRMGNVVSKLRAFPANVASLCHIIIASNKITR